MKKPKQIVLVEWIDSHKEMVTWMAPEDAQPVSDPLQSVGYVIKRDKQYLTLAGSVTPAGQIGEVTHIPRCAVKRVQELKPS